MGKQKTAVQQLKDLHNETKEIHETYAKAKENAQQEVETLTQEIAEGEDNIHGLYKSYVLNLVSLEAYQAERKAIDDKKAVLHVAQKKIADIDGLMKGELKKVYSKAKGLSAEYNREKAIFVAEKKKKMLAMKYEYLKAIHAEAKEIFPVEYQGVWVSELEVELGMKSYSYTSYVNPDNFLEAYAPYRPGCTVTKDEVENAYVKGTVDRELAEAIK
ncbi:hypothetical protein U9M49_07970 [Cytobacillus sp. OWB-43]|uniref:hypothetical protein n=1 Tax=Cytobacillus sp. OWB-43 TaxID=3108468 RepID=UPI002AFFD375|nr:hypothetical protein [Cytobacillus sp. OWB-43]MEA1853024.1 hypothetical protein [Cytobacillus sp. OWB-43]